jgi:hypothetical protein
MEALVVGDLFPCDHVSILVRYSKKSGGQTYAFNLCMLVGWQGVSIVLSSHTPLP